MKNKKALLVFLYSFIFIALLSAQTSDEAYSLYSKGNECFNNGDYITAITYYQNAVPIYEKIYGRNHLYTSDVYFFLGLSYSKNGNYDAAISWLEKSYTIYNSANGDKGSAANALSYIGSAYFDSSNYDKALIYYQNELSVRKSIHGENHKDIANCYANIGLVHEFKGEYKAALNYFQKALAIRQKLFGENDLKTADSYHDIASENYLLGNYQESIEYFFKALKIREELAGSSSYEVAHTLGAIATVYIESQLFDDALGANRATEKIYFDLKINQISQEFAVLYNERGRIYFSQSDYKNAILYWQKALEINQKLYGEKNVYTAKAYSNIGNAYQAMGDYPRAIANQEMALGIYKSIFGNSNPDIALCYRSLGSVYRSKDDFDTALSYFNQALEIYRKSLGEKHLEVARCYIEIGGIYDNKKDFQNALDFYRKGNNMLYDIFGYETTDVASCYDKIARIYDIIGEHEDALSLYNAAINVYKNLCGEESASASIEYNMLGWHYAGLNDVKNTVASFRKSFSGFKKSTNYNQVITSLSLILKDSQTYHYDTDISFIRDTISLATNTVERARLEMSSIKSELLQNSLSIYYYGVDFEAKNNNPTKAFEYSEMLRSRGFLDQIGFERATSLDGVTDKEREQLKNLTSQIVNARKEIESQNNLPKSERNSKKLTEAEKNLSSAEKSLAKLDENIEKRLPDYEALRNPKTAKINDVQKWCGKNRAVLEYVLYENDENTQNQFSYCLVVTNKKITAVPLDSSYDYNSAISSLREAITHRPIKSEVTFEMQRNELYEKLIQPVLPYIKGIKDVLIVPDGNLSFLPFDILREDSDSADFGKKYSIGVSPSVSVSMIADKVKSSSTDALLFGGAWYDKSLSEEEHNQTLRGNGNRGKDRGFAAVERQTNLSVEDLQNILKNEGSKQYFEQKKMNWHDLPGTIVEVETLQKAIFSKAQVESQKMASEATLKKISKDGLLSKYATVHFACHGYFDSDLSEMSSVLFSEVSGKLTESDDDGYLTIGEAATLNLSAQMVCLSACQTGLGEIKKGEGMVGLSRAFMVAGSRNVGVTLWSVDDEATAEFMSRMYKKVKGGMSYSEAYRKVKKEFRNSDEYSHPYYWAAFVVYE